MNDSPKKTSCRAPGVGPASNRKLSAHKTNPGIEFKARFLRAMMMRADMSRGTLWRVAEPVWIHNVKHYVDKGRKFHVGLSIRNRPLLSVADMIPMLIGSSRNGASGTGTFGVSGCFGPESKRTTFFVLRPYQIPLADAYDENEGTMIERNFHKPRIDDKDLSRLNSLLSGKETNA